MPSVRPLLVLLAAVALPACEGGVGGGEAGPRVLELTHDTIRLESGVTLVEVEIRRGADGEFDPARVEARQGDVVRFTSGDRAGHAVAFLGGELAPGLREFLESTGQLRSPPFVDEGSSWVITLDGAPAGEYPFHCTTHNVRGHLSISAREP
ncbi:MAG TPA: plastocyanin/azurin family copper-binding protein [Longimicrobiales bacterium]|nr:plastocyanin/azurin family copper-binding protein [Longimicrobiales bacterium]